MNDYDYQQGATAGLPGGARTLVLFVVILLVPAVFARASEKEKPYLFWLAGGAGAAGEKHEQYSPLVQSGISLRLEGGWAVRGDSLLWDGQIAWSTGTVSSSREQGFETGTSVLTARSAVYGLLPVHPARTTIGLGLSLGMSSVVTTGSFQYEEDGCDTLYFGAGPAVFIEKTLIDRWTFRLHCSLPLAALALGPVWANGSGDELFTEWVSVSDYLFFEGSFSSGFRLKRNAELLFLYTCVLERHNKPFDSSFIHNYLGVGVEIDLGAAQ